MRGKIFILAMLIGFFLGINFISHLEAQEASPNKETPEYRIGPKDILDISVYGHDDLIRTIPVTQEGKIAFPLIGEVKVAGLTTKEAADKLAYLLEKDYIYNPQVTVIVKEYVSQKVSILGDIVKPGPYYLKKPTRLSEIISEAGGIKSGNKKGRKIIIQRGGTEKAKGPEKKEGKNSSQNTITLDMAKLLVEGDTSIDVFLQNDDQIYIPDPNIFFVFGEVKTPGSYMIGDDYTIVKAITAAGGFNEWADTKKVTILREQEGKEAKILVNVDKALKGDRKEDIPILPNDVITVPARFF